MNGNQTNWLLALAIHILAIQSAFFWVWNTTVPNWFAPVKYASSQLRIVEKPDFFDAKVLLLGSEFYRSGQNPLLEEEPIDGILYNYPSGWQFLSWFSLDRSDTILLSAIFAVGFSVGLLILIPPDALSSVLIHALVVFSPPYLNALGMGNGELLVVVLIIAAMKLGVMSERISSRISSIVILIFATTLKLYPAVLLGILFIQYRKYSWKITTVIALGIIVAWGLVNLDDIRLVASRTPQAFHSAFGCLLIPLRAENSLISYTGSFSGSSAYNNVIIQIANSQFWFRLFYVFIVIVFITLGFFKNRSVIIGNHRKAELLMIAGMVLFISTFGIGASWGHRLLCLVLCIPAVRFHRQPRILLTTIIIILWGNLLDSGLLFIIAQLIFWTAVAWFSFQVGCFLRQNHGMPAPDVMVKTSTVKNLV